MDHDDENGVRAPRYEGEDISPTSEPELRGWYSTGLAAEIYAVCGVGSFAPVTLEQLAREAGVLRSDGVTPCVQHDKSSKVFRVARAVLRSMSEREADDKSSQCIIRPFGREIATPSFALYTFSLAVLVQALVLISFSPVADYGTYRKRLLLGFAFVGAGATMAMVAVWPGIYLVASLLTITGVVCLGSTFVLLNSYLPLLAANHPQVRARSNGNLSDQVSGKHSTSPQLKLSTQISSKGVGLGYAAAVTTQILSIGLLVLLKKANFVSESTPLRFVLLFGGICWFLLTLPGALWLRKRPGPPLRVIEPWKSKLPIALQYIRFAWKTVWTTVRTATKLRQTWVFLIAWFLLSDAIATVSGTAILFARTELHMGTIPIALLSITSIGSGLAGAFAWPIISRRYGLQTKQTIIACMILMELIPFYGLLGFIPFVKSLGFLGLQQVWEIYPLGFVHGFVMGGLSSYCRAFYGEIIPPGSEAAFYALYAITDKGSSAVGPAIVGMIVDSIGTIRPAFGFLAILIALPIPLVYMIDVKKGHEEAVALSKHSGYGGDSTIRMEDYDHVEEFDTTAGLLRRSSDDDENQR
ncbi:Putative MFS transporter superfamily [Septoria linicola]|uniref:Autophagy-related protein n=1 Tax=Septoria linicola TaxID=215465 RepID=A0A9Q9EIJ1_9PEZI|nr:putative MFS transporter superfamily [Septoria linicola]USW51149.1 Putative MFS transporter superfamily [Septoria linicola]